MWNQWAGVAAATPMPPIPAPQCPPPQPPPPSAAPPPPSTAPPPTPAEPVAGNTSVPIIGPMLPSTSTSTTPSAPPAASGPYGQYTEAQYAALTPEQQYALQQHWQQWQAYQQEYAKWHAQYGEQYKREMAAAAATGQTMNLNNYYQQAPPQPQIQTQPQQQQPHTAQQPPPPPPPDSQQVTAKFSGTPQLYTQPPPPQLQPQPQPLVQPQPQTISVNQAPPAMNQPPHGGPFPNMGYPPWQQSYSQSQQPQPFNYNQPPPTFAQQPPNFGQIPNFQQPPPMVTQPPTLSQSQPMPIAPQSVQQQPIPPYGNPNQQSRSVSNQNTSNNNKSQSNIDSNFNDSTGPNPNSWAPPPLKHDNDFNKNLGGNTSQWNPKQNKFDENFGNNRAGNQSGPNERGPNNWLSRKDDGGDSNDYNDMSNDGDMNTAFEGRKSRDGFENNKGNSNNRWGCESSSSGAGMQESRNENFPQTRQGPQGVGNQWNNNNRNQGGINNAWNNSSLDSQNTFENDRRNMGNFNDQSGGNRWGNNSGHRDSGCNNNFNQGPGESGRNFGGNNFMHGPNNNFNQRFGQNDRNFGGSFNQRPGGNGRGYGPNNNSNQQFGNNERNIGPNNAFNDDPEGNFVENKDSNDRSSSNNFNFGNRNNFNRWSDSNNPNFSPGNSFNTGPEGSGKNSSSFNPFNSRSHSNDRNFGPGGDGDNFGPNNFNQGNRGSGRNPDRNDNFNPRFGSNEHNFGPNNFNRRSGSNERNFGPNNMKQRSNSNERNFNNNNNFNRGPNSNERVRDSLGRQMDREELQRGNNLNSSPNQGEPQIQNQGQSRLETDNGNRQQRPDLDEKSFDLQFQRWEEQFEQWKRANANHPDREMYRRYEQEFEKQRQRIMERREQMRLRKLQQMGNEAEPDDKISCDKDERKDNKPPIEIKINKNPEDAEEDVRSEHVEEDEGSNQALISEERTIMKTEIDTVEVSDDNKEEVQKQIDDEKEEVEEDRAKVDCPEISNATSKNTDLSNAEKKTNSSVSSLGKRKSRFSAPTESEKMPKLQDTAASEVISLVDEDDNKAAEVPGPMCGIFGKTEGIPGLDLVEGSGKSDLGSVDKAPTNTADESVENELNEASKQKKKEIKNPSNKIPSLFDVVIEKPTDFPIRSPIRDNDDDENDDTDGNDNDNGGENKQKENPLGQQLIHPNISNAIPNLGDALRDPAFMQKISQALAKAQGTENADTSSAPPPQFLQQLPMLLEQLQQQKSNSDGHRSNFGGNGPNYGGNGPNFGGIGPNFGGIGPNFGGNGPNFGGNGPNFGDNGPNRMNFGGNGRNFGDNDPNRANFGGNGPNFGDNGPNRPNFGGNGPNFRDYDNNFGGNEPNFGYNGPNGGNGPNGPNFNRNGPNFNRNGPNFNRFGPNGSNFGGGDGPNFRGDGPNFRGGNGTNFGGGGNGPNFGRNGANDDRRNFGRNNNNMGDSGRQNLFRRGGGNGNSGIEDKRKQSAGSGTDATGGDNSNSSWVDGPGNSRDYGDDFFRPVQVIDYQNSTVSRPKVIDYGHKGSSASGSLSNPFNTNVFGFTDEFKPVKTFDYGHSSNPGNNRYGGNKPPNVNAKKKNKKKKKNVMAQENCNAPQADCANETAATIPEQQQENIETENKHEDGNSLQTANPTETINSNVSSPKGTNEELEEISDNEDNLENNRDNDSPAPPPPPMLTTNKPFICSVQHNATAPTNSLFPSTAAANENIPSMPSGHVQMSFPSIENKNTITVDEILLNPGRLTRPKKVCVILRGPPGSGKSHVAKLIKEKEIEMGGSNPRVLSIDDYFLIENDYEERCPKTGKKIPKKEVLYEYDAEMEETYMQYLIKSFKKTISDNLYDFIIIDCNNNSLRTLNDFYCHSKDSGFMPYIVDLLCELETCLERNIHERSEKDIKAIINTWKPTPFHYIKLDVASLLENLVEMEDAEDMVMDNNSNSDAPDDSNLTQPQVDNETEDSNEAADTLASFGFLKSKWENDTSSENLARLDGTNKLMQKRKAATMEDYLQIDDWEPPKTSANGKKRVRWADIEEKRAQEKMRAIGFVVGQTDWKRMMDPNAGNRALNKTKYIERVNKRR